MTIGRQFCAWTSILVIVALLIAGVVGMVPPPTAPLTTVAQVAAAYEANRHEILVFALFNIASATLMLPLCWGLAMAMMAMQPRSVLLAGLQFTGGFFALIGPFLANLFFAAAAVRLDGTPGVVAALNDLGVIFIELSTLPALLQGICLAIAIFLDKSANPILPRWLAWIALIWSIIAQGGMPSVFFDTGPFSPTGVIGIFLPMLSLLIFLAACGAAFFRIPPQRWAALEDARFS